MKWFQCTTRSARAGSGCKKRKRIKLQCFVRDCNEIFDDDFRHTHNKKWPNDLVLQKKVIPYQVAGATKNPWAYSRDSQSNSVQSKVWNNFSCLSRHNNTQYFDMILYSI